MAAASTRYIWRSAWSKRKCLTSGVRCQCGCFCVLWLFMCFNNAGTGVNGTEKEPVTARWPSAAAADEEEEEEWQTKLLSSSSTAKSSSTFTSRQKTERRWDSETAGSLTFLLSAQFTHRVCVSCPGKWSKHHQTGEHGLQSGPGADREVTS